MASKIIELNGEVGWEITAKGLQSKLPKNGKHATLKIDSFGGSVFEGNRLYNTIIDHLAKFPDSISVELGAIAASAASYFPLAVGAENIKVRENSVFMGHKASIFAWGNSDEMDLKSTILRGFDRMIAGYYNKLSNRTIDETLEDMKNEFWLMGGQSIIDAGFASGIVESSDLDHEPENEVLEMSVVYARLEEIKNKLKEVDNKEDLNNWVAKLKVEPENKTESKPAKADGNIIKEDVSNMNFTEYLNSNPEAKAEHEFAIKNAVAEDRKRGKEILNLSGMRISDEVLNAFDDGSTVGDYAAAELTRVNEAKAKTPDTDLGTMVVTNQIPESTEIDKSDKSKNKATEDAVNKFLAKEGK